MPKTPDQTDPVERTLAELERAERCGLFQRTQVPSDVFQPAEPELFLNNPSIRRWMIAVAAVLVLAIGVWTVMFSVQIGRLRQEAHLIAANAPAPQLQSLNRFAACMAGPAGITTEECREQDRNTDNRVDLRDFSTLLVASANYAR